MARQTRVRFAPSPTGPLHMGGVRTALYNYLYAKKNNGVFLLRIEDTDSNRFVPGAEEYIIEALRWCGIIPDEGVDENGKVVEVPSPQHPHAPYRQSQRKGLYRKYADQLVSAGYAYYAFDTAEELNSLRSQAEAEGRTFIYNYLTRTQLRNSLTLPAEETARLLETTDTWTVRFKMPENEIVAMDDLIRGHIEVNTSTLDDKVLWKRADELPTYHLANIVDDHLMEITEVIRGEEWLPSLPLHYMLYKAFGWEDTMPRFAHLSLLLKPDGKGKLSKRDGDKLGFPVFPLRWVSPTGEVSRGYREDGYFPEAFVNLLALLGWNPGDERELFDLESLVEAFSLDRIVKAGSRFNPAKAHWFNREYLRMKSDEDLVALLIPILEEKGFKVVSCPSCALTAGAHFSGEGVDFGNHIVTEDYLGKVVTLVKERTSFVKDFWSAAPYLFIRPSDYSAFGLYPGGAVSAPEKPTDPRVKVYDDSKTAPFLAKDSEKFWTEENIPLLVELSGTISSMNELVSKEELEESIVSCIKDHGWPMGKVMNGLRLVLTGSSSGLGIADILSLIGTSEVARRLEYAVSVLNK